jgi:hypothetical protein
MASDLRVVAEPEEQVAKRLEVLAIVNDFISGAYRRRRLVGRFCSLQTEFVNVASKFLSRTCCRSAGGSAVRLGVQSMMIAIQQARMNGLPSYSSRLAPSSPPVVASTASHGRNGFGDPSSESSASGTTD